MEFFDVHGVRIAVEVTGAADATPLVLLHGGGGDKSTWDGIAPAFAATHRTYAVDLRGFGDSDRPGTYSFETMRDDVLGLLDLIGADRVDIIGHSMGGSVAWLIAQAQPDRVSHLVIEDSPPPRSGVVRMTVPAEPPPDIAFDWSALVAIVAQFGDPDPQWWDRIDAVTSPTLLLAGGASSHVPQDLFAEVLALLPAGRLIEIPVGHHIHRDAPVEFTTAVVAFLAS